MRTVAFAALLCAAAIPLPSAGAVGIELGVSGDIAVYSNLGACGTLTFTRPVTAVGQFTSVGALTGPSTAVGAVRGALPVTVVNGTSWYGCLPDTYAGATLGYATYNLTASTSQGDFAETLHCTVTSGTVACT
jgi:hypothetical protein